MCLYLQIQASRRSREIGYKTGSSATQRLNGMRRPINVSLVGSWRRPYKRGAPGRRRNMSWKWMLLPGSFFIKSP